MEFNSLLEVRNEIDNINDEMLELFLRRMKCSEEVVRIKMLDGTPIFNKKRENEILEEVAEKSGEMANHSVAFFSSLMAISKYRQQEILGENSNAYSELIENSKYKNFENARVVCQGVQGSYSHKAAQLAFKNSSINFEKEFENVFENIQNGEGDYGILPVENSTAGSVHEVYSLIMKYRFYFVGAVNLRVSHCIAQKKRGEITTVISHPQALMQCGEYIKNKNYDAKEFSNTAAAAKFVSESNDENIAAICSIDAAKKYNLEIVEEDVQDDKNNLTRFVIISKEPIFSKNADKISLCFAIHNETGSLFKILERFATLGLNLSKIESRPIKGKSFEYDFYLDFSGSIRDKSVAVFLKELEKELPRFSFLGNYCEIQG